MLTNVRCYKPFNATATRTFVAPKYRFGDKYAEDDASAYSFSAKTAM
jgi:hypothetical protein